MRLCCVNSSHYEKNLATGLVKCIDDEIPFEIPATWQWVRLGVLFAHNTGKALNGTDKKGTLHKYITTSNLYWNTFDFTKVKEMYFTEEEVEKCSVVKSDLLVCEGGDIGRAAIWNYDYSICIQNHIHRLRPYYQISVPYIYYIFLLYKGIGNIGGKGIGIQGLSAGALHNILLPIPPLAEQQRIVAKIEELLPYIEKYSEAQDRLDNLNGNINDLLRKSILQEAIQGRLVPQVAEEDSAETLLQLIIDEKQKLVKAGKLKAKEITDSTIFKGDDNKYYEKIGGKVVDITEDIPFEIPTSWCWVRGRTIFLPMQSAKPSGDVFTYIDVDAVNNKKNIIDNAKLLPTAKAPSRASRKLHTNDVLFSMVRPYLKNIALITEQYSDAIASTGFYVITPTCALSPKYLYHLMLSPYVVDGLNEYMKGDNSPSINNEHIENFIYPLPPLEEQARIVARIDELFEHLK